MIYIKFKKLDESAIIPSFGGSIEDAGLDFFSIEEVELYPKMSYIIGTGVAWDPIFDSANYKLGMIIQSRSGMAIKHGIECSNAGVIDSGYRGEIKVKLYNTSEVPYLVHKGERIAQGIVFQLPWFHVSETKELSNSDRGTKGFGSSGRF